MCVLFCVCLLLTCINNASSHFNMCNNKNITMLNLLTLLKMVKESVSVVGFISRPSGSNGASKHNFIPIQMRNKNTCTWFGTIKS